MTWLEIKEWFLLTRLEKDALHIYAALVVQVSTALVLRTSFASWRPWLAVAAVLAVNEYMDIFHGETDSPEAWQVAGSLHDAWNTMLLPSLLLLGARFMPSLFDTRDTPAQASDDV